jgi:murein DD-endopeptidase MepM/ murein hydrolase activator NlpD
MSRIPPISLGQIYNQQRKGGTHKGVDFPAPNGTPIPAAADGTVYYTGTSGSFGKWIILEHNINGEIIYTIYAHMEALSSLKKGATVSAGQEIGKVGKTDSGTTAPNGGPHLHFEIAKKKPKSSCRESWTR